MEGKNYLMRDIESFVFSFQLTPLVMSCFPSHASFHMKDVELNFGLARGMLTHKHVSLDQFHMILCCQTHVQNALIVFTRAFGLNLGNNLAHANATDIHTIVTNRLLRL